MEFAILAVTIVLSVMHRRRPDLTALLSLLALLTPISTPVNTRVFAPGGCSFEDDAKLGLPLILIAMTVGRVLIPLFWPFGSVVPAPRRPWREGRPYPGRLSSLLFL